MAGYDCTRRKERIPPVWCPWCRRIDRRYGVHVGPGEIRVYSPLLLFWSPASGDICANSARCGQLLCRPAARREQRRRKGCLSSSDRWRCSCVFRPPAGTQVARSTIHQGFAPGVPVGANPTAGLLYEVGKVCWSTLDEVAVLFPLSPANGKAGHDPLYTGDLPRAFCWAKILCRPAA